MTKNQRPHNLRGTTSTETKEQKFAPSLAASSIGTTRAGMKQRELLFTIFQVESALYKSDFQSDADNHQSSSYFFFIFTH